LAHPVTLIPGDGIGPEVTASARRVLEATGVELEWDVREAGSAAYDAAGEALPEATLVSVRERRVALKGPTANRPEYRSVSVRLRAELDLPAGIRPSRAYPGVPGARDGTDVVIVRMNREDHTRALEFAAAEPATDRLRALIREAHGVDVPADAALAARTLSTTEVRRVAETAFAYARARGRRRVTAVHKAVVLKTTDGLFLETVREVASRHPDIEFDDTLVDNACHLLVREPARFDVLVLPALYGDIVSDVAAACAGTIGLAPGANVGPENAIFEAVHGTAPRHAGRDSANPLGLVLSGAMMLEHLGESEAAARLHDAVRDLLAEGETVPADVSRGGRPATTSAVADALVRRLEA
jgi:isocitrate dehydrogenase (NAD+)